ncbi:TPA: type II toxin-antitoxin system HicA family toxin [Enterobacter hormaechei subsp. steigerwaltii]|uniref:type II toxin-antitoxin system HicA family toxin n=1 Tax=Enterobacter cloacae complex TaxID=354276 RepID=UPI0013D2344F|nr:MULTISPECIES: type II toxin-antitoxin system HicA family toxin [Enterobacter cloacae complex]MBE3486425.1 type II toxin-antitoxin system HicA family toxin [Enterobacter cloacae complex sp. P8BA]MBE4822795.1 type II toxin-antitoxin system HicA family toxin [Enterobacter cloacae complex sp. S1]MBE4899113.1 type II toxin-antitoxin system HicA family toxin [Enterobacter cloacae complex sp. P8RS]HAV1488946.1 type II toxin-antitoxin system HicA family toxin [Enterobacter hormaechei subsp. steigerw
MGRKEKLKAKLDGLPKNFTWDELVTLMSQYGFRLLNAKRGSGRKFYNQTIDRLAIFHEPHPENTLKRYVLEEVKQLLEEIEDHE